MTLHDPAGRRIYGIDNAHAVRLPFILIRCYMAEIDHELEVLLGLDGKNVDITALGRDIRELRDEMRVTSAIVLRLDHMWPDIIEQLRAMVRQQIGIVDRLRILEEQP